MLVSQATRSSWFQLSGIIVVIGNFLTSYIRPVSTRSWPPGIRANSVLVQNQMPVACMIQQGHE
ncbi:hypothetical protein L227DRAFT_144425 [Lentinus tigrinus ALCF2SS1-6]|uniref:Uncharacterized protein n=1 Tax=Lentinus tigrinus ALCF2SS1-6 TaxID=1328759 RepID=A0A5C2SSX5_9APHY|nr:hypothetical protein L227DRAFT_144425 [Lentinus tigrinus ALCF2SS1-6]